jgi:hypothetical protein
MKKLLGVFLAILLLPVCANATVLTFDDISTNSYGRIPNGYGGFNWELFWYLNPADIYPNSGFNNALVSGNYIAGVSDYAVPGIGLITGSPFTFNGAYLTAGWNDGLNVKVDGYLSDILIYSTTVVIDTTGPTWYVFNYENIDKLEFSSYGGTHHEGFPFEGAYFAMDNFTYIPEPITALLLGLGYLTMRESLIL